MSAPAVKFCGLTRREDARLAASLGAVYGGVILASGGKRSVTPGAAAEIFLDLPLTRVGVFVDAGLDEVRRAADEAGLHVLQLHGSEPPALLAALQAEGRWAVWKAVRPRSAAELRESIERYRSDADALLLDGWSAAAAGGTGARFPWEEIAACRDEIPDSLALVVAGGLTPGNVERAITLLRPAVVDVSSGVESAPGVKDPAAMPAFLEAVHRAALDFRAASLIDD
jgi:phosphoribosylanthranilate isomerase